VPAVVFITARTIELELVRTPNERLLVIAEV
jgi:hypothetical protein